MTPPESKPEPAPDFIDTNDDSVPAPVRIALAGKHELFVDVLIDALIGSGTTAWWTPGNSTSEVLDHLQEQPADLVLLNSDPRGLPELTIDLTTQLEDGQLPVIVLGTGNEPDGLYPYMAAGALAVVDKSSADFDELAETIRIAVNGDHRTLREWHLKTSRQLRSAESQLRHRRAPFDLLTEREAEVLHLICQGCATNDIARHTYVSIATTRSHIRSILLKLDVHSQLAAAAKAHDSGWYQTRVRSHPNRQTGPIATSPAADTPKNVTPAG